MRQQAAPALGGGRGEALVGLGGGQVGAGLQHLLVEVGRVDVGQHLAGLHLGADVDVPALQIAADPGVDRGGVVGLRRRRAGPGRSAAAVDRWADQLDGRDRLLPRSRSSGALVGADAADQAADHDQGGDADGDHAGQLQPALGP